MWSQDTPFSYRRPKTCMLGSLMSREDFEKRSVTVAGLARLNKG